MERIILISDYHTRKNNNFSLFDKKYTGDYTCKRPWDTLIINQFGDAYICSSPAWLPKSIGNILDFDNIFDLLNTPEAKSIRTEILDNRFTYCNSNICNFFMRQDKNTFVKNQKFDSDDAIVATVFHENSEIHEIPDNIVFDFDYTCNFVCPSCRTELINNNNNKKMLDINFQLVEKIKKLIIDNCNKKVTIRWAGGEPFISKPYLKIWEYIVKTKNTNIENIIQTNGSYLKKKKILLEQLLPFIKEIWISFDAGTALTYKKIRVNGVWDNLIENVKLLKSIINQTKSNTLTVANFVTQTKNFKEIPDFVKIAKSLEIDIINIDHMWNWGTWSDQEFKENNITSIEHPAHDQFLKILSQVCASEKSVRADYWKIESNDQT